ncbi:MAG TPA: beta-galactosidase [Gemmataceae bacterium]|nr:beta-galactosidase [Gemmataceae bacterium]
MPPVLCWIMAALRWATGSDREWVTAVIVLLQNLTLIGTGLLVVELARRTTGRVGPATGVFVAVLLGNFRHCFQFTHDCWIILAALDLLVAGLVWARPLDSSWRAATGWGVFGGLCALISPVVGFAWGILALAGGWRREQRVRLALALLAAGLMVAPWVIRNYLVFGRFIPVKSNLAYELHQSQCLQAGGVLRAPAFSNHPFGHNSEERRRYKELGETAYLDDKWRLFRDAVRAHPGDFVHRVTNRFLAATLVYVPFTPSDDNRRPEVLWLNRLTYALPFLCLLVLVCTARWRPLMHAQWMVMGVYILYLLPYVLASYYERYKFPVIVAEAALLIWGIDRVWQWLRATPPRDVEGPAFAVPAASTPAWKWTRVGMIFLLASTAVLVTALLHVCLRGTRGPEADQPVTLFGMQRNPPPSKASPFFPFIDTFGQYKHADWPGKTKSLDDLLRRRDQEAEELRAQPGPSDWDRYGGWATGPQLEATGFFRTQKYQGKWWLVDPDGKLFFSQGIDVVLHDSDVTPIDERGGWFEDFPGERADFRPFLSTSYALKGHYAGRSPQCFCFRDANLLRKYGGDWQRTYPELVHRRLRSWGLNTLGMWCDEATRLMRQTPYTDDIVPKNVQPIRGSTGDWGAFPDVFDTSFEQGVRAAMARRQTTSAGDPWCVGYFSDNELSWGDDTALPLATLRAPAEQAAKQVFVADLRTKYGDIAALNTVWGTAHGSWEDLLQTRQAPDQQKARDDLLAFNTKLAEHYFRTMRQAINETAPHQLYLGCRFSRQVNACAAAAAAKSCDVVSYNLYRRSLTDFGVHGNADVPLLVGEFSFGALDRGLFHPGFVAAPDQQTRARAYGNYVQTALQHPQFVGTHWFQYQDEPTTGRVYDEENCQFGFVDVADTPYPEIVGAARVIAGAMYRSRANP